MNNDEYIIYLEGLTFSELIEVYQSVKSTSTQSRIGLIISEFHRRNPQSNDLDYSTSSKDKNYKAMDSKAINFSHTIGQLIKVYPKYFLTLQVILAVIFFKSDPNIVPNISFLFILIPFLAALEWHFKFSHTSLTINSDLDNFEFNNGGDSVTFSTRDILFIEKNICIGQALWRKGFNYRIAFNIHLSNKSVISIPNTVTNQSQFESFILESELSERTVKYWA